MYTCIYIYIYIYREREVDRYSAHACVHASTACFMPHLHRIASHCTEYKS